MFLCNEIKLTSYQLPLVPHVQHTCFARTESLSLVSARTESSAGWNWGEGKREREREEGGGGFTRTITLRRVESPSHRDAGILGGYFKWSNTHIMHKHAIISKSTCANMTSQILLV